MFNFDFKKFKSSKESKTLGVYLGIVLLVVMIGIIVSVPSLQEKARVMTASATEVETVEVEQASFDIDEVEMRTAEWQDLGYSNVIEYNDALASKREEAIGIADAAIGMFSMSDEQEELAREYEQGMVNSASFKAFDKYDEKFAELLEECSPVVSSSSNGSYYVSNGSGLTRSGGVFWFQNHKETYYNLNMSGVINNAQNMGISGSYWVRDDGVKMYGDHVIVASSDYSKGTVIETSLGSGIVLDYCPTSGTVDIATAW